MSHHFCRILSVQALFTAKLIYSVRQSRASVLTKKRIPSSVPFLPFACLIESIQSDPQRLLRIADIDDLSRTQIRARTTFHASSNYVDAGLVDSRYILPFGPRTPVGKPDTRPTYSHCLPNSDSPQPKILSILRDQFTDRRVNFQPQLLHPEPAVVDDRSARPIPRSSCHTSRSRQVHGGGASGRQMIARCTSLRRHGQASRKTISSFGFRTIFFFL